LTRLRIILLGYIVRGPIGGMAWHHLQYVLGLHQLGHDVYFAEDSDDYPSCYDPTRHVTDCDPTYGLKFSQSVFHRVGLGERWCYYDAQQNRWHGPAGDQSPKLISSADLLLNLSGVNPLRSWTEKIPARALVDTDPLFTQVRHLTDATARSRAAQHTAFFTFGENIPDGQSSVPADGFRWQTTRQPIVLDAWPVTAGPTTGKFTTVMQWDSYPAVEWDGKSYGMKSRSFESIVDLPRTTDAELEVALGSAWAPRDRLLAHGWLLRDPLEVTRDPWTYQAYLQQSKGEFSVAKHGYVVTNSGWFSERSACFLASGRPCVVQDTGFSRTLPCGAGLLAYQTIDGAVQALAEVHGRYEHHCRAGRDVVREYFDARKVLMNLIERAVEGG
jgi:hypothetical protein